MGLILLQKSDTFGVVERTSLRHRMSKICRPTESHVMLICLILFANIVARALAHPLSSNIQNKTAVSETSRLLFVAGLEGSGHHAIAQMMSVCEVTHWSNGSFCEYEAALSSMMVGKNDTANKVVGLFSALDSRHISNYLRRFHQRMVELASDPNLHLYYVGLKDTIVGGGKKG
jgi:hypothetical protein